MIQVVDHPTAHKQAFATAIQGAPYFRAVMGRDLALWADNPGAPVRLFTLPGAALTLNGSTAQLCGTPQDWEELLSFLQFAGIAHLIAEKRPYCPLQRGSRCSCIVCHLRIVCRWRRNIRLYAESQPICLAPGNPAFPTGTGTAGLLLFRNLYRAGPRLCPCAGFAGCSRPPGEHWWGLMPWPTAELYGNGGNPAGAARAGHRRLADSLPGQRAGRGGLDRDIFCARQSAAAFMNALVLYCKTVR